MKNLSFVFLIILISCSKSGQTNYYELKKEVIDIPITSDQLPFYLIHYFSADGSIALGGDKTNSKFDLFDLKEKTFMRSIEYDLEGPKGMNDIRYFFIHEETLYALGLYSIYKFGVDNDLFQRLNAEEDISFFKNNNMTLFPSGVSFHNTSIYRPCINREGTKLYHVAYPVGTTFKDQSYFEKASLVEIDLESFETKFICNVYEQSGLSNAKSAGDLSGINLSLSETEDSVIFTIHALSDIYIADLKSKALSKIKVEPNKYNPKIPIAEIDHTNVEKYMKDMFLLGQYLQLSYDPHRKLYYRLHQMPADEIGDKFLRSNVLSILDRDFKLLEEHPIEASVYPDFAISEDGLIFRNSPGDSESYVSYTLLKVDKD
ncbi:MAG: DUF4221 domain-containing protein [Cyclobacteriaceae bacterium]|nr:DUF4221 family protein [Cyclobacteriaceae bacterium]MCH8516513.1 DUF4221 domain-containing protein [Cyclobacteriaceae bacterium]